MEVFWVEAEALRKEAKALREEAKAFREGAEAFWVEAVAFYFHRKGKRLKFGRFQGPGFGLFE